MRQEVAETDSHPLWQCSVWLTPPALVVKTYTNTPIDLKPFQINAGEIDRNNNSRGVDENVRDTESVWKVEFVFIEPLIKYTLGWPLHNKIHQIISDMGAETTHIQDPHNHNIYHPRLWVNPLISINIWTSDKQRSDLTLTLWIKIFQIQDKHFIILSAV